MMIEAGLILLVVLIGAFLGACWALRKPMSDDYGMGDETTPPAEMMSEHLKYGDDK